jgi:hypothetical protein
MIGHDHYVNIIEVTGRYKQSKYLSCNHVDVKTEAQKRGAKGKTKKTRSGYLTNKNNAEVS